MIGDDHLIEEAGCPGPLVRVELEPGVEDLLWRLGEDALTVEMTLDFEGDVQKQAVAFPGAGEPSLGFQRVRVGDVDVWWRQRLVLASREAQVTSTVRPRRLVVGRVGQALSACASYAEIVRTERKGRRWVRHLLRFSTARA